MAGRVIQVIISLLVSLGVMILGMVVGYPTKAVPQLLQESHLNFDQDDSTWFASMFHVTGVILTTPGGILSGKFGRKKIILFSLPFLMIGWLLIGFAQSVSMIFFGRLMTCAFVCLYMSSIGVYISESVHSDLRGSMVVLSPFFLASGMLIDWIIGYFYSWKITAFFALFPCLILLITMTLLPETPYWLIQNNRFEDAKLSMQFFRGPDQDVSEELNEIHQNHLSKKNFHSLLSILKQIWSRAFFKPFTCIGLIYCLSNLTGFEVVVIYMVPILKDSGSGFDHNFGPIIVGSLRVTAAAIAPFVVRKMSPKILFILSQLITAFSMGVLGFCTFLKRQNEVIDDSFGWIPLVGISIIIVMRGIATLPVMHTLLNELYPTEIRSQAVALTETIALTMGATSLTIYPYAKAWIGLDGACLFYFAMGILCTAWGALTISDNRGKTLVKIEESIQKRISS